MVPRCNYPMELGSVYMGGGVRRSSNFGCLIASTAPAAVCGGAFFGEQNSTFLQKTSALIANRRLRLWFQYFTVPCSRNSSASLKVMFQYRPIRFPKQEQHHLPAKSWDWNSFVYQDVECIHSILRRLEHGV